MAPSEAEVRAAVAAVEDPDLRRALGELGMVRSVTVKRRLQRGGPGHAGLPLAGGRRR